MIEKMEAGTPCWKGSLIYLIIKAGFPLYVWWVHLISKFTIVYHIEQVSKEINYIGDFLPEEFYKACNYKKVKSSGPLCM